MKVIVTGGAGFIGSHLVDRMVADGHQVTVLDDLSSGRADNLESVLGSRGLVFRMVDLLDTEALSDCFSGVDWVFHLAASRVRLPNGDEPARHVRTNVQATLNVLECARRYRARRFVYAASASSYGTEARPALREDEPLAPRSPHALSKGMGEELVLHWARHRGLPALSLRLFNVYGPRAPLTLDSGSVTSVFLSQRRNDAPLTIFGDGAQERDFVHVDDVCQAFVRAAERPISGFALNVGSGRAHSIRRLAERIGGDRVHVATRGDELQRVQADITRARRLLEWEPRVPFEAGIDHLLERLDDWKDSPVWSAPELEARPVRRSPNERRPQPPAPPSSLTQP